MDSGSRSSRIPTGLLWFQGLYYFVTGVWPLVSVRSFQAVTGKKTDHLPTGLEADHWLVMTVAVLITAISLAILTAAVRRSLSLEIMVLAVGAAIGLTTVDVIYVMRRVISPIYLIDAAVEIPLILARIFVLSRFWSGWRLGSREVTSASGPTDEFGGRFFRGSPR